eukprot:90243_1
MSLLLKQYEQPTQANNSSTQSIEPQQPTNQHSNCPGFHGLTPFVDRGVHHYTCDVCKIHIDQSATLFGCRECNYDICSECHTSQNSNFHDTSRLCLDEDIRHCGYLKLVLQNIKNYNPIPNKTSNIIDNISQICDRFCHLVHKHDTNKEFDYICDRLKPCDIKNCTIFKRFRRNRQSNTDENDVYNHAPHHQIMDKLHCYYLHSKALSLPTPRSSSDPSHAVCDVLLDRCHRYNQLCDDVDHKQNHDHKTYHFGFKFYYGYAEEERDQDHSFLVVSPLYGNLKEEVTQKSNYGITTDAFENEYKKGSILFNLRHCRENIRSLERNGFPFEHKHLLAMMMYTNCDRLQYYFSKTYRDNEGKNHRYFYHFGMYLKICIKRFGTRMHDICERNPIHSFYHGISEQLVLSEYIGSEIYSNGGILIHGVLSTSSQRAIALAFAKNGLMLELKGSLLAGFETKCFSVSWLSNFSEEKEYVCGFNNDPSLERLHIANITNTQTGEEFRTILNALRIINRDVTGTEHELEPEHDELFVQPIVQHQLSINKLECISDLCENMIDTSFKNTTHINLRYKFMKHHHYLFGFLWKQNSECIDMKRINALFPNIIGMNVDEISEQCIGSVMDGILLYLCNNNMDKLQEVHINKEAPFKNNSDVIDISKYGNIAGYAVTQEECSWNPEKESDPHYYHSSALQALLTSDVAILRDFAETLLKEHDDTFVCANHPALEEQSESSDSSVDRYYYLCLRKI